MRGAALLIDLAVVAGASLLVGKGLGAFSALVGFGPTVVRMVWWMVWALFLFAFLARDAFDGGSPGHRLLGLRVVVERGTRGRIARSILRNLPLVILPLTIGELRRMRLDPHQRRLGDRWAGTRVDEA